MKKIYRLKTMAWIGTVALATFVLSMLLAWCIPTFRVSRLDKQLYTIRHQELRDNNTLYIDLFLNSIKDNNGYLVLGTSETNTLKGGNYYDFLNSDKQISAKFSVIAGAGRTACTYFPIIQGNANVENLKVIYFINPTYWTSRFSKNNRDYFHRYVSYAVARKANRPENPEVEAIYQANRRKDNLFVLTDEVEYAVDRFRRRYYQDLRFALDSSRLYNSLSFFQKSRSLESFPHFGQIDSSNYCFEFNMSDTSHLRTYNFRVDTISHYRYDELLAMIRLCKERHVDVTFVIGPYNKIAFSALYPSEIPCFERLVDNIRMLLDGEGCRYVDASELSEVPGVFKDWQHHSSYGAYMLYGKIKEYVLEKENR